MFVPYLFVSYQNILKTLTGFPEIWLKNEGMDQETKVWFKYKGFRSIVVMIKQIITLLKVGNCR